MNSETKRMLMSLNYNEFVTAVELQESNLPEFIQLSFDDRLSNIVDTVYQMKFNERIKRLVKYAKLRYPEASLTSIDYSSRKLNKAQIDELATMKFIGYNTNISIEGFTGSGKTYLSCALAKQACINNIRTYTVRLPDLLQRYSEEKFLHREKKFIQKMASYPLLVIDEWLIFEVGNDDIRFIYELIELRYCKASTIFVSQYPNTEWHKRLGGGAHADSILDRIVHNLVTIESGDTNMRSIFDSKKLNNKED